MLGRVLTEEEERQRHQAAVAAPAEAESSHVVEEHDAGAATASGSPVIDSHMGSLLGYGSVQSFGRYAADEEQHNQSDYEEYTTYDESENDESFESYDNNASSGDEDSYLLHPNRRRKRKSRRDYLQNQSSFHRLKKSLRKVTRKCARKMKSVAVIIADVDNVWDSPEDSTTSNNSFNRSRRNNGNTRSSMVYDVITGGTSTIRNRTAAIFWFVILSISYASERSTFKVMVDRVGPFRLFSAEVILGLHVLFSSLAMSCWNMFWKNKKEKEFGSRYGSGFGLGLPLADVGLMAILDTVYLLVGIISGAHVPPVLTVILVQAVIPLTACFTQCVHPDGRCSGFCFPNESDDLQYSVNDVSEHYPTDDASTAFDSRSNHTRSTHTNIRILSNSNLHSSYADGVSTIPNLPPQPSSMPDPVAGWGGLSKYHLIGTGLMFLAIFMGLTPALLSLDEIIITEHDAMPQKTAYNTIVFCFAAIPAAISQLYKERTMTRLKQPIDRNKLNLVLSVFQLLFAVVVSPLAYGLQGMGSGSGWTTLYPSKQISENFSDGFYCFLGHLDKDIQATGYPEEARCNYAWELVVMHVISILLVGVACDKLAAATKIMYRGVSMGIMVGVIFMFIYQIRDKWCEYGPIVSFFHLTSTAVLIVGADVYHRVSLADASFDTVYPEIGDLYEDE